MSVVIKFENCDITFINGESTDPAALSLVGKYLFEKIGDKYTNENICDHVYNIDNMYWIECIKIINQLRVKMTIKRVFT